MIPGDFKEAAEDALDALDLIEDRELCRDCDGEGLDTRMYSDGAWCPTCGGDGYC